MTWWIVAILLLAVSLGLGLSNVVYVAYALLGVLLASRFLTQRWTENLAAHRRCSRLEVNQRDKVAVVVEVTNRGRWRVLWTLLEDLLPRKALAFTPPSLEVVGERLKLASLGAGETMRLLYQLTPRRRGYYQLGPLVAETGDVFGLHRRYRILSQPSFLTVYPDVEPLLGYDIASPKPIGEIRMAHRLFEDPTRQAGVRAYQPGDPLRKIHWRATARTGSLQSKIYEPSSVAGATVVLDFHEQSYPARDEPVRSELAVTTAVSLAYALYEMGQQVGLITNGRDAAERVREEGWDSDLRTRQAALAAAQPSEVSDRLQPRVIPTGRGPQQPLRIRDLLARLEKTDGLDLPELLRECSGRLPRDATVIAIVNRVRPADAWSLIQLRRQGFSVAAIVNVHSTVEFADRSGPLVAAGIPTYQLVDSASVGSIARQQLGR
ncbi:MAG: DUF58 domain-containing protein [Pirellulales bacterium]